MDKFVISPHLSTKRVVVDGHGRADSDSVYASGLEEQLPPPKEMIATTSTTATASIKSNFYKNKLTMIIVENEVALGSLLLFGKVCDL